MPNTRAKKNVIRHVEMFLKNIFGKAYLPHKVTVSRQKANFWSELSYEGLKFRCFVRRSPNLRVILNAVKATDESLNKWRISNVMLLENVSLEMAIKYPGRWWAYREIEYVKTRSPKLPIYKCKE